jgi:hypothetical protein
MRYARSILHECVLFHTILNTLSQISFAFKNDTPQCHNANYLFMYYAFASTCMRISSCMQIVYSCIHWLTEAYKAMLKYQINNFTPQDGVFCFVVCMHYVSCIIYNELCNMQYHHACMHYELMLFVLWIINKLIFSDFFCFQKWHPIRLWWKIFVYILCICICMHAHFLMYANIVPMYS